MGNAHSVQLEFRENFKLEKFYTTTCKGVNLDRRWKTEKPRNFLGSGKLRVNDHGNTKTFFDESDFFFINGVTDAGDGLTVVGLLRDQTAEKVQLVRSGNCDQDICSINPCLH